MSDKPKYKLCFQHNFHTWKYLLRAPELAENGLKNISSSIEELKAALHAQLNKNYPFNPKSGEFENAHIALSVLERDYIQGDPVALIEAFILSVTNFDFAPQWVLEALREKFNDWHIAVVDGPVKTMDECLGISSQQHKRSTPVDKHNELTRDGRLCYEMHCLLMMIPGLKQKAAAKLVAETDRETGGGEISAGTLSGEYSSVWKAVFASDKSFLGLSEAMDREATNDERRSLLLCYKGGQKFANDLYGQKPTRTCRRCNREFTPKGHFYSCAKCRRITSRLSNIDL